MTHHTLADSLEAGAVEMQRELLGDAWDALGPVQKWTGEQAGRFGKLLDAGAYVDAAMMLIPRGWPSVQFGTTDDGRPWASLAKNDGHMMVEDPDEGYAGCEDAATIALAIAAACLRAHAHSTDGENSRGHG